MLDLPLGIDNLTASTAGLEEQAIDNKKQRARSTENAPGVP